MDDLWVVRVDEADYAPEDIEDFEFTVENLMDLGYDRESAESQVAVHFREPHTCDRAVNEE